MQVFQCMRFPGGVAPRRATAPARAMGAPTSRGACLRRAATQEATEAAEGGIWTGEDFYTLFDVVSECRHGGVVVLMQLSCLPSAEALHCAAYVCIVPCTQITFVGH